MELMVETMISPLGMIAVWKDSVKENMPSVREQEIDFQTDTRTAFQSAPMSLCITYVDEFGSELDYRDPRRADDILFTDESCVRLRDPHMACIADRFAAARSKMMPPCSDNNQTVDSTLDCYTTAGKMKTHYMQVSYSQNSYIYVCGGDFAHDDHCGTYLEIHKANGTPYDDEAMVLSDVKITSPVTNGMQTTTLPLLYKGDPSRILCSYEEIHIQVGSMVRVNSNAPSCCCPPWLSPIRTSKIEAFFCPKRQWSKDGGPFAPALKLLEEQYADDEFQQSFPWSFFGRSREGYRHVFTKVNLLMTMCPSLDEAERDIVVCTQERVFADDDIPNSDPRRCMPSLEVENDGRYSSVDLSGMYYNACPYGNTFEGCGLAQSPNKDCHEKDHHFTFKDEIGKVVHVPDNPDDEYGVSFNDARSVYWLQEVN